MSHLPGGERRVLTVTLIQRPQAVNARYFATEDTEGTEGRDMGADLRPD